MNVLYVITELGLGGAEVLLVNLANAMHAKGHHVEIGVLGKVNEHSSCLNPGIAVHLLDMKKSLPGVWDACRKLRPLSKSRKWDVVHAHMFHANIIARLAGVFFGQARIVSTAHSNNEGGALRMLAYRLTDFLSDVNTNVSANALNRYVALRFFSKRKSALVYNFIDTDAYRPDPVVRQRMRQQHRLRPDEFVVLNVGRLVPEKNHVLMLEALAIARAANPALKALLIGDGAERARLEARAAALGLESSVRFCGIQRNVADWCNLADLFVLSSAVEGFGLVLGEAIACGCPAISTDVGGCAEVVGNPELLVPAGDARALAAAILRLAAMPMHVRADIARRQRDYVRRNFDLKTVVAQWESIYAGREP